MKRILLAIIGALVLTQAGTLSTQTPVAYAHSGGLNAEGCHTNRKTGDYHCHRGSKPKPVEQPAIAPADVRIRIQNYFRAANDNVGALSCSTRKTDRNVSQSTKSAIKRRDGNRCVACGSTRKLEVDHRRALMNGGSNDRANLATLCDECHTIKTRLDSSLRRKRKASCGN